MGFLNNADETEVDVPDAHVFAQDARIQRKIAAAEASLPDRFPPGGAAGRAAFDKRRAAWDDRESARAIRWTRLRPASAKSTLPHLRILPDDSVLVSGDQSKSDRYQILFDRVPDEITALRLEALPDASLPKHGPGRVFYEGPFGDFELSEFTAVADGAPVHFKAAVQSFASNPGGAAAAIDGSPLTSWTVNGGQGKAHAAIFIPDQPLRNVKRLSVGMLFEYYYAAGLGHFRLSAATGPIAADRKVLPPEVDDLLTIPRDRRTAAQQASLNRYFASIVPELKAARKEIVALRHTEPVLPTSLVLSERPPDNPRATYVHKRGDFLRPTERVEAGVPSLFGPVSSNRTARPVEFRPLARQPPESTHRPGHDEPAVASVFRHRPGENDRGLRLSGHPADAPRAARLACGRTVERELVAQGDAPLDCDKHHIPPVVPGRVPGSIEGSGKQAPQPCAAGTAGSRACARRRFESSRAC